MGTLGTLKRMLVISGDSRFLYDTGFGEPKTHSEVQCKVYGYHCSGNDSILMCHNCKHDQVSCLQNFLPILACHLISPHTGTTLLLLFMSKLC